MRIAFSIILNGLHHLKHNDYYKTILENFDHWIVVEGACKNTGSTSWCDEMSDTYHKNGYSVDGTSDFLKEIKQKYSNLTYIEPLGMWQNKDVQVNRCIEELKKITDNCLLWEIDVDEQWTINDIKNAEDLLIKNNAKTGCFLCNYFVGRELIALGDWGEGRILPYRRLWNWKGEYFKSHEPPVLDGKNGPGILIPIKFNHYSFYFDQDVKFKEDWYKYDGLYVRWKALQSENNFPQHVSKLLGASTHWGNSNTIIRKIK